jgi:hypothetical protein
MAKKSKSSLRARRAEQLAQQKKKRRMYYIFAGIGAVVIIALFAVIRQANAPSLEDVKLPETIESPPDADGKNWGPEDAPVVIEEYSDFQ